MRIRSFIIPVLFVFAAEAGVADQVLERSAVDQAGETAAVESADVRREKGEVSAVHPPVRRAQHKKGSAEGSIRYHTMLFQILMEPDVREKIGLDADVYQTLVTAFKAIDEQVKAKQTDLGYLQATQAKLIVDGAHEADVMVAVDAVWKARAEIAKLQTIKLLKMRSLLTEKQIGKLDEVRHEIFRERRKDQLREGGAKRPKQRKGRPKRQQPAVPEK